MNVEKTVNGFKTKHKQGFMREEMKDLIKTHYPQIKQKQFNEAVGVVTGVMIDGDCLVYHHDIAKALQRLVEGRKQTIEDWD